MTTQRTDDLPATSTLWDRHDVARYLGYTVGSVNTWLRRHSVTATAIIRDGHGRTKNLYSPARVIGAQRACTPASRRPEEHQ